MMKSFYGIILFFCLFTYSACNNLNDTIAGGTPSLKELKRIISSDKKVEAVLIETNGGVTTSFGYLIFIVVPGTKITVNDGTAVFNADHQQGIDINWKTNKQLIVSYEKARIFNYTNFWETSEIENFNYVVEIKLLCTSPEGQLKESDKHPMSQ